MTNKDLTEYEAIGRELGMSGSAVRQIEKKALYKMRRYLAFYGLTLADILPLDSSLDISRDILNRLPAFYE